jgi:hypothetical protein
MTYSRTLLAIGMLASLATLVPVGADARPRGGGFHAGGFHGPVARPGWHGGGTRWARPVRPGWRGGAYAGGRYYRGVYGWGYPAAAGVAAGAALGAAAAYGSSCYRTQSVWNGYSYVQQSVRVC